MLINDPAIGLGQAPADPGPLEPLLNQRPALLAHAGGGVRVVQEIQDLVGQSRGVTRDHPAGPFGVHLSLKAVTSSACIAKMTIF